MPPSDFVLISDSRCWQYLIIRNRHFLITGLFIAYLLISSVFVFRHFKHKSSASGLRNEILSVFIHTSADLIDIHIEDVSLGHTGEVSNDDDNKLHQSGQLSYTTVAIGGGITSKGVADLSHSNVSASFQLLHTFLPTFCATASPGYAYHFYFAYDVSDSFFAHASSLNAFKTAFESITSAECNNRNMTTSIHLVQCSHAGKPTWAQNDAMREAYLDNVEYYYRINDDTRMQTKGWMEQFVRTLSGYNPPNVGVVGPNHSGGNTFILTYDFVHRTHVEVFGFYYPRLFTDWWGDDWITGVYVPGRSTKLEEVRLAHTMSLGQRYQVDKSVGDRVATQINRDRQTLNRYISHRKSIKALSDVVGKKVISMSLYGKNPRYTWGAIRNAQIIHIYFPDWKLRIYILDPSSVTRYPDLVVPRRIINTLRHLGVELAYVKNMPTNTPPHLWRYMIIDDADIDFFLIRDADGRLSDRDAAAVEAWLDRSAKDPLLTLHCIRDHPKQAKTAIVDGMWGGRTKSIRKILGENFNELLRKYFTSHSGSGSTKFLSNILWPALNSTSLCHDSVSCDVTPNNQYFSRARESQEYVGETFDEHHVRASNDYEQLKDIAMHCNRSKT